MALSGTLPHPPRRGRVFRYESWAGDAERGLLTCRYSLDGREFTENVTLPPGPRWDAGPARAAARLVFLLAGVSYYKTAAPPVIDLGQTAYRNALDLTSLRLEAQRAAAAQDRPAQDRPAQDRPAQDRPAQDRPAHAALIRQRPLPFHPQAPPWIRPYPPRWRHPRLLISCLSAALSRLSQATGIPPPSRLFLPSSCLVLCSLIILRQRG